MRTTVAAALGAGKANPARSTGPAMARIVTHAYRYNRPATAGAAAGVADGIRAFCGLVRALVPGQPARATVLRQPSISVPVGM
jgi:hypothetical protein